MKEIKDPVHSSYIQIEEDELDVLDSKPMQRLRRINQLGLSQQVYPSATHTRFAHSLGVLYISNNICEKLNKDEEFRKVTRMGALLHDIGHGPFSHVSEEVSENYGISHEQLSCEKIEQIENRLPVDSQKVIDMIKGKVDLNLVSGEIDSDRMDYLKRDSNYSGIEHGEVEVDTIINSVNEINGHIVFDKKARQSLENFLIGRKHMLLSVYKHTTSRIAERMLKEGLKDYAEMYGPRDMMMLDDSQAHVELMNMDTTGANMYQQIINSRDLYKNAFELNQYNSSMTKLEKLAESTEEEIKRKVLEKTDLEEKDFLVDLPRISKNTPPDIRIFHNNNIKYLREISKEVPIDDTNPSFNIYSTEQKVVKVNKVGEELFSD